MRRDVASKRSTTGIRIRRQHAFCSVVKWGTWSKSIALRSSSQSLKTSTTPQESTFRNDFKAKHANSCGSVNFLGLNRCEYGGRDACPISYAARSTFRGDFDVVLYISRIIELCFVARPFLQRKSGLFVFFSRAFAVADARKTFLVSEPRQNSTAILRPVLPAWHARGFVPHIASPSEDAGLNRIDLKRP